MNINRSVTMPWWKFAACLLAVWVRWRAGLPCLVAARVGAGVGCGFRSAPARRVGTLASQDPKLSSAESAWFFRATPFFIPCGRDRAEFPTLRQLKTDHPGLKNFQS
jgi:hypothetical protein